MPDDGGLDIDLMTAIAGPSARARVHPVRRKRFDGIFDALNSGASTVSSRARTVTPDREKKAAFAQPYLISGQALAVEPGDCPKSGPSTTSAG